MATFQVNPPDKFNFKLPEDWPKWLRRFERFRQASGLFEKSEEVQVNTLLYSMGDEADDILSTFGLTDTQKKEYKTIKDKFFEFFIAKRNIVYERAKFNRRKQEDNESVDGFVTDLYNLAEHCNYGTLHDELIRDRIVVGIRDLALSEKLQIIEDLTLTKALNMARQWEAVKKQQDVIRDTSADVDNVQKENKQRRQSKGYSNTEALRPSLQHSQQSTRSTGGALGQPASQQRCGRCGKMHHRRDTCPARLSICDRCKRRGHWSIVCRSRNIQAVCEESSFQESAEDTAFLGMVDASQGDKPWEVLIPLGKSKVTFKMDTGADVTVLPHNMYSESEMGPLTSTKLKLYGPSRQELDVKGKFTHQIAVENKCCSQDIYVVKGLQQPLLGRPAIRSP